jgi:DNA-binding transcriptional regulator/RsmH inhibitor MraZ
VISDQSSFLDLDLEEEVCFVFEDDELEWWWEERWEEDISVSVEEDS